MVQMSHTCYSQGPVKRDAEKQLQTLAVSSFDIPGDSGFPLNEFFAKPSGRADQGIVFYLGVFLYLCSSCMHITYM